MMIIEYHFSGTLLAEMSPYPTVVIVVKAQYKDATYIFGIVSLSVTSWYQLFSGSVVWVEVKNQKQPNMCAMNDTVMRSLISSKVAGLILRLSSIFSRYVPSFSNRTSFTRLQGGGFVLVFMTNYRHFCVDYICTYRIRRTTFRSFSVASEL